MTEAELTYLVRTGHFNWANPSEFSTNIYIGVVKDGIKTSVNLSLDEKDYDEFNDMFKDDPLTAVEEAFKVMAKRYFFISQQKDIDAIKRVIRENYQALEKSITTKKIVSIEKQIEKLSGQLEREKKRLSYIDDPLSEEDLPFPEVVNEEKKE